MDLLSEIIHGINWVEFLKYALAVGIWEAGKIIVKKFARMNPIIYFKKFLPFLVGTIMLLAPESLSSTLNIATWILYITGAILIAIVILPYVIKIIGWLKVKKDAIQNWKK